jgi:adenylate kinase
MIRNTLFSLIQRFLLLACAIQLSAQETPQEINNFSYKELESLSHLIKNKVIFFTGYPGSGKGTQGKKLAQALNIGHLSTGELFRAEAAKKTPIGMQMDYYMQRGEIIPNELSFQYLKQELAQPKYRNGFILDGYPKNMSSCAFILETLNELQFEPFLAFHFEISRPEVIQRLTGRLHCKQCESDYHKDFLKPKIENVCDTCRGHLESRDDDSESAINRRLDVFEENTNPVIQRFSKMGILTRLNASNDPNSVTEEIIERMIKQSQEQLYSNGSYHLRPPKFGKENSSVFHNHIDAESHLLLREIVSKIENRSLEFQNKIYPVSHLVLGPQVMDPHFSSIYQNLPNFHSINNAANEAFSTGKMGEEGFNYDQVLMTLGIVSDYAGHGVMTELEEEIFEKVFDQEGHATVVLDRGCTPYTVDWSKLPGWKERQIKSVPHFELHHGFEITKLPGEETPPIDLSTLSRLTTANGFSTGGWFVFRKKDQWAYRCNEFSNNNFDQCLETLNEQADRLREIVSEFLEDRKFTSSCSLEKVHAIWCL